MPDALENLKIKQAKLKAKVAEAEQELLKAKEKLAEVERAIFEREDGRLLKVVKKIMVEKQADPDMKQFVALINAQVEAMELRGSLKKRAAVKQTGGKQAAAK